MWKIGEYVVYQREVGRIEEIKKKYYKDQDYYILSLVNDSSLKVKVPTNNPNIRKVLSKQEVLDLIEKIPTIETIEAGDRLLETEYKNCLKTSKCEDLIKIIKTTYLRNKEREDNHKKKADKDNHYFEQAEKYLYTEFSIALEKTQEQTKEFVIASLSKKN